MWDKMQSKVVVEEVNAWRCVYKLQQQFQFYFYHASLEAEHFSKKSVHVVLNMSSLLSE